MEWRFPDVRLAGRAGQLFERIVATGSLVLRRVGGGRAGEVAAHRFLDNERVGADAIIDTLAVRTLEACVGRRILAIQDTTEINFSGHDASRRGLGPAAGGDSVGFFIHPLIAVDRDEGAVLGLIDAEIWTRDDGPTPDRRRLPFADKESARWLRGVERANERLSGASEVVTIGDRESDIYALFARRPDGSQLIVRASHNRKTTAGWLFEDALDMPNFGEAEVELAARPGQKARTARILIRAGEATLTRPADSLDRDDPAELQLNIVVAAEQHPPKGVTPVIWRLLTTLPVASREEAEEVVRLYRLRWRIEEVFRTLKSDGLDLEATQVEEAQRLFKLAALGIAAAVRILQLVDARDGSTRPATDVADPSLFNAMKAIGKTLEGKTERQKNPHAPGSLAWLSWIVARLGGWNCYCKPPGPKTMATGWKQLAAMTAGFILAKAEADV